MTDSIETKRQHDYERFERNRYFEESTDIAERLGYPIDTVLSYSLRDGALYANSDTEDRPFHQVTAKAKQAGWRFQGDQAFERLRLAHEHDEALIADQLAAGKVDGNVMIVLSKVPDAVAENKTTIQGYRRDLLRSFVRVYWQTPEGLDCRLFSLDHASKTGLDQVGELLGIATSRSSEAVLADRQILRVTGDLELFVDELTRSTKRLYDVAMQRETGVRTFAGSRYLDQRDALTVVQSQKSLLKEHMAVINGSHDHTELESHRERIAAAIKLAVEGYVVESIGDNSVSKEVEQGNYGGECASAAAVAMNGMNQARQMENVWSMGECQVCFTRTSVGSCMVCAKCAAADDHGEDLLKLRQQYLRNRELALHLGAGSIMNVSPETMKLPRQTKESLIQTRYGRNAQVVKRNVIGGAKYDVIRGGELVATI